MDQKRIGCFIAELRKEKHLTQVQLGEKLGVTNKTVSRWETGEYMPDLSVIQLLCKELGIDINELLSAERLDDTLFRKHAEDNVLSIINYENKLRKNKKLSSFLEGGGTGLLIAALYSPDTIRRTATIAVGILMVCLGWYCHAKLDKYILRRY